MAADRQRAAGRLAVDVVLLAAVLALALLGAFGWTAVVAVVGFLSRGRRRALLVAAVLAVAFDVLTAVSLEAGT